MISNWLKGKVVKGTQKGRAIGFPTININPAQLPKGYQKGVYAATVKLEGNIYYGVLFYGSKDPCVKNVNILEIHLFHYNQNIYGRNIYFLPGQYIRKPRKVSSSSDLKKLIAGDCIKAEKLFSLSSV